MGNRKKDSSNRPFNIWNGKDFSISGFGKNHCIIGIIRHFFNCLKWSGQRINRGYADCDVWDMYSYLQTIIPDMLQNLKDNRMGSPGHLGENYTNEDGLLLNDTCHTEWNRILDRMIYLWRESDEETCSKKNIYEKRYMKAFQEFQEEYGPFGSKLRTPEELKEDGKKGTHVLHFMDEVPKYKQISDKYLNEDEKLERYRRECKDKALDMLKQYFYDLWD